MRFHASRDENASRDAIPRFQNSCDARMHTLATNQQPSPRHTLLQPNVRRGTQANPGHTRSTATPPTLRSTKAQATSPQQWTNRVMMAQVTSLRMTRIQHIHRRKPRKQANNPKGWTTTSPPFWQPRQIQCPESTSSKQTLQRHPPNQPTRTSRI